jgi:hypothetical protein
VLLTCNHCRQYLSRLILSSLTAALIPPASRNTACKRLLCTTCCCSSGFPTRMFPSGSNGRKARRISRSPADVGTDTYPVRDLAQQGPSCSRHLSVDPTPDCCVHVSVRVLDSHCVHLHRRLVVVACRHCSARANRQSGER